MVTLGQCWFCCLYGGGCREAPLLIHAALQLFIASRVLHAEPVVMSSKPNAQSNFYKISKPTANFDKTKEKYWLVMSYTRGEFCGVEESALRGNLSVQRGKSVLFVSTPDTFHRNLADTCMWTL